MQALGVTIDQVKTALQRENVETPEARWSRENQTSRYVSSGGWMSPDSPKIVVANKEGTLYRGLRFRTVEDDIERPIKTLSRLDGKDAVTLLVRKQSGTNTVEIVDLVKNYMARIRQDLPSDLDMDLIRDQSIFINASIHAIEEHLILRGLSGQPRSVSLHAKRAFHPDRCRRSAHLHHRHVRRHQIHGLHAQ